MRRTGAFRQAPCASPPGASIGSASPPISRRRISPRAEDFGGRVVIPGLINTHTHGGLGIHRGVCDVGDFQAWARQLAPHTSTLTLEDNR